MRLMLVTFTLDNTQFLVNVSEVLLYESACEHAIKYAQEANKEVGGFVSDPENGLTMEEVMDTSNYEVEDIDFALLKEMFRRDDCQTANCGRRFRRIIFGEFFDRTAISSRRMQAVSGDTATFHRRQEEGSRLYFSRGISSFEIRPRESRSLI